MKRSRQEGRDLIPHFLAHYEAGIPNLEGASQVSITEYRYEYDQYGNWTERTTTQRLQPVDGTEPREFSIVDHRTLTYF